MPSANATHQDNVASNPLQVKLHLDAQKAYAGEWLPIQFELSRALGESTSVRLHNVISNDPDLVLDLDMVQHGIELRPGEHYCFQVPLRVAQPKIVNLASIQLAVMYPDQNSLIERQSLDGKHLRIKPSLKKELKLDLTMLYEHEGNYKIVLVLTHIGATDFREVSLSFPDLKAIKSGKLTVQRAEFLPGETETIELFTDRLELDMVMAATVGGQRAEWSETLKIQPSKPRSEQRFRFLEPRGLAQDSVKVFLCDSDKPELVPTRHSMYTLRAGSKYRIEIRPIHSPVKSVELHGLEPNRLLQRAISKEGVWSFTIEVVVPHLLRRREQIYYEVTTERDGTVTGEIPTCVIQTTTRFWQTAAALGFATTLQGASAFASFIQNFDLSLIETLSSAHFNIPLKASMVFSIPLAWVILRGFDWLQFQFQS